VSKAIESESLLARVVSSGRVLLDGLMELERLHPDLIRAARGLGTFCSFDCPTPQIR
jgi:4-aminobutyrate aminotransferase-like enzyme